MKAHTVIRKNGELVTVDADGLVTDDGTLIFYRVEGDRKVNVGAFKAEDWLSTWCNPPDSGAQRSTEAMQ